MPEPKYEEIATTNHQLEDPLRFLDSYSENLNGLTEVLDCLD